MSEYTVIVDIDGTIADARHRLPLIKPPPGVKKNWNQFFEQIPRDGVYSNVITVVNTLYQNNNLLLITGRPEKTREATEKWLTKNKVCYDQLYMRAHKDSRPDYIIKEEIFRSLDIPASKILCVFEDRLRVVEMWKDLGLTVFVCGHDYEDLPHD